MLNVATPRADAIICVLTALQLRGIEVEGISANTSVVKVVVRVNDKKHYAILPYDYPCQYYDLYEAAMNMRFKLLTLQTDEILPGGWE